MNKAIVQLRDLRTQLEALEKRLGAAEQTKTIAESAAELRKKITAVEEALIQVNASAQEDEANYPTMLNSKLGYLTGVIDSADTAPTAAEQAVFAMLDQQLETQLRTWKELQLKDLTALNESMRNLGVPSVAPAEIKGD